MNASHHFLLEKEKKKVSVSAPCTEAWCQRRARICVAVRDWDVTGFVSLVLSEIDATGVTA